jgi:hypothetical protein
MGLERPIDREDLDCGKRGIGNRLCGNDCCICTSGGILLAYTRQ